MLTSGEYGLYSSVYTSLTGTGLTVGRIEQTPNTGHMRMLVQNNSSGGTITDGAAVMFTSGFASSYVVDATTGVGTPMVGVNDMAGASIPAGSYFWITIKGFCKVLVATGTSINDRVSPSATAGTLGAQVSGMPVHCVAYAANSSGSQAKTLCYIY